MVLAQTLYTQYTRMEWNSNGFFMKTESVIKCISIKKGDLEVRQFIEGTY